MGEFVREKIFDLFGDEIPYHVAVMVNEFKEKEAITVIQAVSVSSVKAVT